MRGKYAGRKRTMALRRTGTDQRRADRRGGTRRAGNPAAALTVRSRCKRASGQCSRRCGRDVRFDSPGWWRFSGHRPVDHRSGSLRQGLVVPCQATVLHQPAEGPLDHPPLRQRIEPLGSWSLNDLHIDAQRGPMVEDAALVAAVGPTPWSRQRVGRALRRRRGVVDGGVGGVAAVRIRLRCGEAGAGACSSGASRLGGGVGRPGGGVPVSLGLQAEVDGVVHTVGHSRGASGGICAWRHCACAAGPRRVVGLAGSAHTRAVRWTLEERGSRCGGGGHFRACPGRPGVRRQAVHGAGRHRSPSLDGGGEGS